MAGRKTAILSVRIVSDAKGFRRGLKESENQLQRWGRTVERHTASVARFTAQATKIALVGAAALSTTANMFSLSGSLLAVAGAGVALPGMFLGMATGAAVLFAALKDAPTVLADLGPKFSELQKTISGNFWDKAAKPIRDMVENLLPGLSSGTAQVATALGVQFGNIASSIKKNLSPSVMADFFSSITQSIKIASGASYPLIHAFTQLGTVGAQWLPLLATGFVKVSQKFDAFISNAAKTGQLDAWINGSIAVLQQLGSVVGSVATIFGNLIKAASAAGGATLSTLAAGLKAVADVTGTPEFQSALTDLFFGAKDAIASLSAGLGPLLASLAPLLPVVGDIMRVAGQLAGSVLTTLAAVIQQNTGLITSVVAAALGFAQALAGVADWASKNADLLTALAVAVGAGVAAWKAYQGISAIITGVKTAITGMQTAMAAYRAGLSIATAVQAGFNVALSANPIGIVVVAIAALVAGLIWFFTQTKLGQEIWANFTKFLGEAWANVVSFFTTVGQGFAQWWNSTISGIGNFFVNTFRGVSAFFNSIWTGIKNFFVGIVQAQIRTFLVFRAGVQAALSAIGSFFSSVFNGARNFVAGAVNGMVGFVRNLGNGIGSILGSIGRWFADTFNFARNIVAGVVNSIVGGFNNVVSAVQNAINWVSNLFNGFSVPGWMRDVMHMMGMGGTGFDINAGFSTIGLDPQQGATGLTMSISAGGSLGMAQPQITNNTYNITVEGAIDPYGTAKVIKQIMKGEQIRQGAISQGGSSLWG